MKLKLKVEIGNYKIGDIVDVILDKELKTYITSNGIESFACWVMINGVRYGMNVNKEYKDNFQDYCINRIGERL